MLETLTCEIEEKNFLAVNESNTPTYQIKNAFISSSEDNTCLCIDVDPLTREFICNRLNISNDFAGEGTEGFINTQHPISAESQTYLAGSNWNEEIVGYFDDQLMTELISDIIDEAAGQVSRRDYELKRLFGTANIETYDNGVLHGYYNGLSLALLENKDTGEAYVTFECSACEYDECFPVSFKTFSNIDAAQKYIEHHCDNHQTLQDFGISHDIFNEFRSEDL